MSEVGYITQHRKQRILEKSKEKSNSHSFATVWVLECTHCNNVYGANSCDVHLRKCPSCQGGQQSEPLKGTSYE